MAQVGSSPHVVVQSGMAPETAAHRGYLRRDESIREEVTDLLARDALLDAGDIEILVEQGAVTLAGWVFDGFQRLRAADLAETVEGVRSLRNALAVPRQDESADVSG